MEESNLPSRALRLKAADCFLLAYVTYTVFILMEALTQTSGLNMAGCGLMLAMLILCTLRSSRIMRPGGSVFVMLLFGLFPLVQWYAAPHPDAVWFVKHVTFAGFYVLIHLHPLPPPWQAPRRQWFVVILSLPMVLSLGPAIATGDAAARISGIFVNPNNFALLGFSFLFLIDSDDGWRPVNVFLLCMCILCVAASGTSGAFVALLGTAAYHCIVVRRTERRKKRGGWVLALGAVGIASASALLLFLSNASVLTDRLQRQAGLAWRERHVIMAGESPDYKLFIREGYTDDELSLLWRLAHWTQYGNYIIGADPPNLMFGHNIGAARETMRLLPHNDYLRILFEQGVVGISLYLLFWTVVLRRIPARRHFAIMAFLLYSASENLVDNLYYCWLLFLYVSTAERCGNGPDHLNTVSESAGMQAAHANPFSE